MKKTIPREILIDTIGHFNAEIVFRVLVAVVGALLGIQIGGQTGEKFSPFGTLLLLVVILCGWGLVEIYRYYYEILGQGGKPKRSLERKAYANLRSNLEPGRQVATLYASLLTDSLNWVDRFFGDSSAPERTLFPRAFGLRTPAPLWTAPAFDRCLLIALIYPLAALFGAWAISGQVGAVENAVQLQLMSGQMRLLTVIAMIGSYVSYAIALRGNRFALSGWLAVPIILAAIFGYIENGHITGIFAMVAVLAVVTMAQGNTPSGFSALVTAVVASLAFACVDGAVDVVVTKLGDSRVANAASAVVTIPVPLFFGLAVRHFNHWSVSLRRHGRILTICFASLFLVCMSASYFLVLFDERSYFYSWWPISLLNLAPGDLNLWHEGGILVLFLGIFTLVNVPFDWAALGLTRALLRRGLELRGWWMYLLAIVDAAFAIMVIAVLTAAIVLSVQTFDALAKLADPQIGELVDVGSRISLLSQRPGDPANWWIYTVVFSTITPSILNLAISGFSLVRGVPWISAQVYRNMPEDRIVPLFKRTWMATVLTAQIVFAGAFGIVTQCVVILVIVKWLFPLVGMDLLNWASDLATAEIPQHLVAAIAGL